MNIASPKIKRKFTHLKPKVVALRKSGRTYGEIREIYNIPKSTLSDWLKTLKLSNKIKKEIQKRGFQRWKNKMEILTKRKREEALKSKQIIVSRAKKEIGKIGKKELRVIGAALYWAEGGKKDENQLRFSNSTPEIIKTIIKFFKMVCGIPTKKIKARIHLYPGINQNEALKYWMKITGLPKTNFYPPQFQVSRASKGKRPKNTLPYGTLHLVVVSKEMAHKVKGWIQGISEKILRV